MASSIAVVRGSRSCAAERGWARRRPRWPRRPAAVAWHLAAAVLGGAAPACWDAPTSTLDPAPVISFTLVEEESLQVAAVRLTTPGDSEIPSGGLPAPAGGVELEIEDDSGHAWPVAPTATLGRFTAAMSPRRGARYRLRGNVVGRAIAAETRVPTEFAMTRPAGDTITAADTAPCTVGTLAVCVPIALVVEPGLSVGFIVADSGSQQYEFAAADHDELRMYSRSDRVRDLYVLASNADVALRWRAGGPGNTRGVLVGFGASLVVRRKLYIP